MGQPTLACMIATIGRPTLPAAIASALPQFDEVLVIADDADLPGLPDQVVHLRTGRRFDQYGSAAWNMGAYATGCDWVAQLGDDDQWTPDAAATIRDAINSHPEVDVWTPGLRYNDGHEVCLEGPVIPGHVAAPICRPKTYFDVPMSSVQAQHGGLTDYAHIHDIAHRGNRVGWLGQVVYLVRPEAPGRHGGGQP